jgi:hypothetical protein
MHAFSSHSRLRRPGTTLPPGTLLGTAVKRILQSISRRAAVYCRHVDRLAAALLFVGAVSYAHAMITAEPLRRNDLTLRMQLLALKRALLNMPPVQRPPPSEASTILVPGQELRRALDDPPDFEQLPAYLAQPGVSAALQALERLAVDYPLSATSALRNPVLATDPALRHLVEALEVSELPYAVAASIEWHMSRGEIVDALTAGLMLLHVESLLESEAAVLGQLPTVAVDSGGAGRRVYRRTAAIAAVCPLDQRVSRRLLAQVSAPGLQTIQDWTCDRAGMGAGAARQFDWCHTRAFGGDWLLLSEWRGGCRSKHRGRPISRIWNLGAPLFDTRSENLARLAPFRAAVNEHAWGAVRYFGSRKIFSDALGVVPFGHFAERQYARVRVRPTLVQWRARGTLDAMVQSVYDHARLVYTPFQAARLVLAINAYDMDNGHVPTSLEQLVPAHIDCVPGTSESVQSFAYRAVSPHGYVLRANAKRTDEDTHEDAPPLFTIEADLQPAMAEGSL